MKQKTITINGKEVTLAYTYRTEIAYRDISGEDINDFMTEAQAALNSTPQRMPDIKKSVMVILAASLAYTTAKGAEPELIDTDLMDAATPEELGKALGTVITLRIQFYTLPAGEPEDKPKKGGKRAKKS